MLNLMKTLIPRYICLNLVQLKLMPDSIHACQNQTTEHICASVFLELFKKLVANRNVYIGT